MVYSRAGISDLFFDLRERDNPRQLHVLKLFHFVFLFLLFIYLFINLFIYVFIYVLFFTNGALIPSHLISLLHIMPSLCLQPWSKHLGTLEEMRHKNAPC